MVEEFMLLANISVAQKIYDEFPDCAMLRKHPAPPPSNYDVLQKAAKSKVRGLSKKDIIWLLAHCSFLSLGLKYKPNDNARIPTTFNM